MLKFIEESVKMKEEGSHDRIHELLSNLLICEHSYTSKQYYQYHTLIIKGAVQKMHFISIKKTSYWTPPPLPPPPNMNAFAHAF